MKELNKKGENFYLSLNDDDEIKKGIQTIETRNIWNYENLIINKERDETLTIQNQLFWFEEKEITSKIIEDCFNLVFEHFQRLKKNKDFSQFISKYFFPFP
jgi:alpha/beta superfamily hydrolase